MEFVIGHKLVVRIANLPKQCGAPATTNVANIAVRFRIAPKRFFDIRDSRNMIIAKKERLNTEINLMGDVGPHKSSFSEVNIVKLD